MLEPKKNMSSFGKNREEQRVEAEFLFHSHRYFPYEQELARMEIEQVVRGTDLAVGGDSIIARVQRDNLDFRKLTYFAAVRLGGTNIKTTQHQLEQGFRDVKIRGNRQATRYSVHGIHEYKGKFNPQLARFILNYFHATSDHVVLDPFCGSGTTLVEAAFQKVKTVGIDMNPLAVFISNAKQIALSVRADELERVSWTLLNQLADYQPILASPDNPRLAYLNKWFLSETLSMIEHLKNVCDNLPNWAKHIILALSSDLIRTYSLQEPSDLRIRRRRSPLPTISFCEALENRLISFCSSLRVAQDVLGVFELCNVALLGDARNPRSEQINGRSPAKFDFVVTSPPYATALPYIDTQRLSLVWLGLCSAEQIVELDAEAVGSRELRGTSAIWSERLLSNADNLPAEVAEFCLTLREAVSASDGFRRKAVPQLIYRYYADMQRVFVELHRQVRTSAKLGFVVGSNQTTLGGEKFVIDTPRGLASIANQCGFRTREVIPLDTYQRFGLHSKNGIASESLTVFEALDV